MQCKKCGQELLETDKFCPKCGAKNERESTSKEFIPIDYHPLEAMTEMAEPTLADPTAMGLPEVEPTSAEPPAVGQAPQMSAQPKLKPNSNGQVNLVVDENGKLIKYRSKVPSVISTIFAFVFLVTLLYVFIVGSGWSFQNSNDVDEYTIRILILVAIATIMSATTFICSILMYKKKLAGKIVLVTSIFSPLNIFSFGCGVVAILLSKRPILKDKNLYRQQKQLFLHNKPAWEAYIKEHQTAVSMSMPQTSLQPATQPATQGAGQAEGDVQSSTVQKQKMSKGSLVMFIIMCAYYGLVLFLGISGMATDWDILGTADNLEVQHALNYLCGYIMIAAVPTFGVYLAMQSTFKFKKMTRIICAAVAVLCLVVLDIVFFTVKAPYSELLQLSGVLFDGMDAVGDGAINDNIMLTIALFLSQLGILILYGSRFIHLSYDAMEKQEYIDRGYTGGQLFFSKLWHAIMNGFRAFMVFKEYYFSIYALIGTVIFTIGIFAAISLIIVVVIVLAILGIFGLALGGASQEHSDQQQAATVYVIEDEGVKRKLYYKGYDFLGGGGYLFKDSRGYTWKTENDGKSFYLLREY